MHIGCQDFSYSLTQKLPKIGLDRTNQITRKQETIDKERRDFSDKLNTIDWLPSSFHIRTSWGQAQFLQIFINFSPFYGLLTIWFSWRIVQQLDHFQDMIMVSHGFTYLLLLWSFYFERVKLRYLSTFGQKSIGLPGR